MRTWTRGWLVFSASVLACGGAIAGCGGDSSTNDGTSGGDGGDAATGATYDAGYGGGDDATTGAQDDGGGAGSDAGSDGGGSTTSDAGDAGKADGSTSGDAAASDAGDGGDAAPVATACSPLASACTYGGTNALCQASGVCGACTDVTDDAKCQAAYGGDGGADAGSYMCAGGQCVIGQCHTSADCTGGALCNASHVCAGCNADGDCKGDPSYGSAYMCNTTTHACVADTCATPNAACSANASDVCCAGAGGNTCVAGNCCSNAQCGAASPACQANTCTACDAVSNGTYYVDPVNGSDALATGSDTAGGATASVCAFKTIGKALSVIGGAAAAGTKVVILGSSGGVTVSSATNGEVFPLAVPKNVTITTAGGAVTVSVGANLTGFTFASAPAGINGLTIDGTLGQSTAAGTHHGIVVSAAAAGSAAITIASLTVKSFNDAGIRVDGFGKLAVSDGVIVSGNGVVGAPRSGLRVTDNGTATIAPTTAAVKLTGNTQYGLLVDGNGSVSITGSVGAAPPSSGTVLVAGNQMGGIEISDTPNAASPPPASAIDGATISGNLGVIPEGNGVRVTGGSGVKIRNSWILANAGSGVYVANYPSNADAAYNDVSRVDLGTNATSDPGKNVLQDASSNANVAVGVCLNVTATLGASLNAYGNVFNGTDCSASASTGVTLTKNNCAASASHVEIGLSGSQQNTIKTYNCQN